ncbi:FAD:protein FMN transferase [Candidatus Margulisiibacteriota bacterium]
MLVMGTVAEIIVKGPGDGNAEKAVDAAFAEMARLETMFSFHDRASELNKINDNAFHMPYKVSLELYNVLDRSMQASLVTGGLFDITTGSLSRLYGFNKGHEKKLPGRDELKKAMRLVNYKLVKLDPKHRSVRFLKKGIVLDLGGSVKGYAIDRAVEVLKSMGINSGLVNIGGNMYGFGPGPWKIGVRHPRNKDEIIEVINLKDSGVATSGDYERFFIKNSLKVHHIFDPRTGRSATENIGVTVIAKDAFTADIFSTGIFILDREKAKEVIKKENLQAIIISEDGNGDIEIERVGDGLLTS